ncbi:MAG TPA: trypsin-like peptidase domain-containing protein [Anaerolineales bacterium]|nr:trypsin-like peptidase domain-containing protein [Anaerolineales bacterium]
MKKRTTLLSLLAVFGMIFLAACGSITLPAFGQPSDAAPVIPQATQVAPVPESAVPSNSDGLLSAYQGTLENIYSTVSPSVVNIRVVSKSVDSTSNVPQIPGFPFFNLPQQQGPQQQFQTALGSGFVWDEDGHIVTNNHVINGADQIEVTFSDGTIVPATLVGADPDSDLAVIKVDVPTAQLHPVALADSNSIKVGQLAIAIGNPFGLEGTMTTGIISAIGRSLPTEQNVAGSYSIPDIIQTDAPINPGNSGGVLVDANGALLGVTSAIESPVGTNAGIGFAIPSEIVNKVIPALIKDGKYIHTWLGISGTTLIPDLANAMDLQATQRGVLVEEIMPNSPAEKAGLRGSNEQATVNGQPVNVGGDVITAIDNQSVTDMEDLIAYLTRSTTVDQKITLDILRDGKKTTLDVTLVARPSVEERTNEANPSVTRGIRLGILGANLDSSIAKEMNLPEDQQGVLVQQVEPGSLADTAGLQGGSKSITVNGQQVMIGGDIITAVNGEAVTTVGELRAALGQLQGDQEFSLTVLRNGKEMQITLQAGQ